MEQAPHSRRAAGTRNRLGQLDVQPGEIRPVVVRAPLVAPPATAVQDARQVDDELAAGCEPLEHSGRKDIGLYDVDRGKEEEMLGALAPTRRNPDANGAPGERVNEVAADETRAADHQDILELHGE